MRTVSACAKGGMMIAPRDTWNLPLAQPGPGGATDWLANLHTHHGPGMKRLLRRILGHEEDAQDAYQDCLYRLARRNPTGPPRHLRAYAYRTANNLAIEILRRRRRRAMHFQRYVHYHQLQQLDRSPNQTPADSTESPARPDLGDLRRTVSTLPKHLRDVLVLRELAGLSYAQVATMLDIKITSARVYRRQALVHLGRKLTPFGPLRR